MKTNGEIKCSARFKVTNKINELRQSGLVIFIIFKPSMGISPKKGRYPLYGYRPFPEIW